MKDLEARLSRLERTLPTEENRLMALWWEYGDGYVFARLRDGDVEASLAAIYGAMNPEDAAWVIAFSDELIANNKRKRSKSETKD